MKNAGSCQCGNVATCGTGKQTGNRCTSDDEMGSCTCGLGPACNENSVIGTCLNNASPPVFKADDANSTCKCYGNSCTTATIGRNVYNGACSLKKGNELLIQCFKHNFWFKHAISFPE